MVSLRYLFCAAVAGLAAAAPCAPGQPTPPSKDPWYTGPDGYEKAKPGDVLRIRPAPGNLTSIVKSKSAWNIMYRTTDSQYKPTYAVTTLFVPPGKANDKALLSYQFPYDSADVDASPSYAFYTGSLLGVEALQIILSTGFYLNVPDYEGPLASFTAGVMSGHATIDSVRAVRSLHQKFGLKPEARYAMWGYSGGALASEWAAELQVQYAPEMKFAGAVLGGLTPNVTSVLYTINKQASAGLGASAILGLGTQYPDILKKYISKLKTTGPYTKDKFLKAYNYTLAEAGDAFKNQDLSKYFENGFDDVINKDTEEVIFNDGIMGYHGVPTMPLFVHKAIHDEISLIKDTDDLVAEYCKMGANIKYTRNTVGNHESEALHSALPTFAWLASILTDPKNGTGADFPERGCEIKDVTLDKSPISL